MNNLRPNFYPHLKVRIWNGVPRFDIWSDDTAELQFGDKRAIKDKWNFVIGLRNINIIMGFRRIIQ